MFHELKSIRLARCVETNLGGWMHPPFCSRVELHKGWCSNTPGYLWVPWRLEGCDYHFMPFGKPLPIFGGPQFGASSQHLPQDFCGGLLEKAN